ncbi:MAG: hypothetical protein NDJ90_12630 [Oligoflexia bacterium]|nr:hypothetical protein [Oligoflexia bacterium]
MKAFAASFVVLSLIVSFAGFTPSARAEGVPAAKVAVRLGDVNIVNAKNVDFATVATTLIKGSSTADLLVDINLVCGLFTGTTVRTKDGVSDTSSAEAAVYARVLIDGKMAAPGEIPLCKRSQTLSATLQGIISECKDANGDGTLTMATECTTTPEEISLVLDTTSAHGFLWAMENVGSGVHKVELQVKVGTKGAAQLGSFSGYASVGQTSFKVERGNLKGNELLF